MKHSRSTVPARRADPTGTTRLRIQFVAEMRRRWAEFRRAVYQAVAVDDVLGLGERAAKLLEYDPAQPRDEQGRWTTEDEMLVDRLVGPGGDEREFGYVRMPSGDVHFGDAVGDSSMRFHRSGAEEIVHTHPGSGSSFSYRDVITAGKAAREEGRPFAVSVIRRSSQGVVKETIRVTRPWSLVEWNSLISSSLDREERKRNRQPAYKGTPWSSSSSGDFWRWAVEEGPLKGRATYQKVPRPPVPKLHAARRQFAYASNPEKARQFMSWLDDQEQRLILGRVTPRGTKPQRGDTRWTDRYVSSAYKRGVGDGLRNAKALAPSLRANHPDLYNAVSTAPAVDQYLAHNLLLPVHQDTLELIYSRAYRALEGVTDEMDGQISRVLTSGLAEGRNPKEMARSLTNTIDGMSAARARTIARTEVIHAHAEGKLNLFEQLGFEDVNLQAEWSTAGDEKVCPRCHQREGRVYSLKQARGQLPLHPNCRCSWLPVVEDLD